MSSPEQVKLPLGSIVVRENALAVSFGRPRQGLTKVRRVVRIDRVAIL